MFRKHLYLIFVPILWLSACSNSSNLQLENSFLFDQAKSFSGFDLETSKGQFKQQDLEGKLTFIYFGFTSCPDICPLEMNQLGEAFKQLSDEEKEKVQGLFISVDPKRDSLEMVANYAEYFHPSFIGARIDNSAKLLSITTQLGSYYEMVEIANQNETESDNQNYLIDHTSSFTIIDPEGLYAGLSPTPHTVADLVVDIQTLINHYF